MMRTTALSWSAAAGSNDLGKEPGFEHLTICRLLALRARNSPFRIALSAHSVRGGRDRLSYAQLSRYACSIGIALADCGVARGDRVAVLLGNEAGREAVLTALGCFAIGAIVVPLNVRSSDDELDHALALVRPVLLVTTENAFSRLTRIVRPKFMLVDAQPGSETGWPDPALHLSAPVDWQEPFLANEPACLLFTSGTTSRPKAVVHSHRTMIAAGSAVGASVGLTPSDLYQGAFPFFTSSCLNIACMSSWVYGAGFVMEEPLQNQQRLRLVEAECSTVYHGVPSVIQFMLDAYEAGDEKLLRLVRRIAYGGAAMPESTIERIGRVWPWMEQVQVWGMTESGPAGTWLPPQYLPDKPGSIGKAMPNCEVKVVDQAGHDLAAGEVGQLLFRGRSMALGYYNDPEETAKSFRDGWLHTGDLVVADDEGFLRFVDRSKDVINRGGLKISSASVEAVIYQFQGVQEAAAIAVPHSHLGEDVAACVVTKPGLELDLEALQEHCRKLLADYEVPRHWFVMQALPRNPMGKILKRELRTLLTAQIQQHEF